MQKYSVGDAVVAINNKPLRGNSYAPSLEEGGMYEVMEIVEDSKGNQHLHVGLASELNYVTSYETGEYLPNGDQKHWCHPSRFEKVEQSS